MDSTLPDVLNITGRGTMFQQAMEYRWKPNPCTNCKTFTHSQVACPKSSPQPKAPQQKDSHKKKKITRPREYG